MVVIRCTQKLLRRMGPPVDTPPRSTTRLGDWYGNLLGVGHQRFALFVSEHCRLPVVLPARDLKNAREHLITALGIMLRALGVSQSLIYEELEEMADASVARTVSRSLLGTLTDFGYALKWKVASIPEIDLVDLALYLSETPVGPMGYDSPRPAAQRIFA